MAGQEEKPELKPRLSKTSQKAGKTASLEFGKKVKSAQLKDLKWRIAKAEKQTEGLKNEEEEELEVQQQIGLSEPKFETEPSNSQTIRDLPKMGDKKTMPILVMR